MKASTSGSVKTIKAVDVHGHYGACVRADHSPLENECMTASAAAVADRARRAGIEWTVVSPLLALFPRGKADAAEGNREAFSVVPKTSGLRQWVVVNPLQAETYAQAENMLKEPWCVGIKIHPEEHRYPIREHGARIFEFAARFRAVVLTHSGEANSMPADFVPWADSFPEVRLILAHIGCGWDGKISHQVRAVQASRRGNIFADTSSAMSVVSGLIEWAVREIGADRILFGTDTPLYFAAMQRARVEQAEIEPRDREKILSANARKLLPLG